jgi:hypothetical protein
MPRSWYVEKRRIHGAANSMGMEQHLSKTYSKMRVYIWLEGQDVDCINNISNGDFSVTLQFAVPETVEGEG